jgi:N12 class adenine-specific DNA methylase
LVRLYNDSYNNLRPRLFDGSHLDFPGMNRTVQLRPHQNDAVWRCMSAGNTLLAHLVGAGIMPTPGLCRIEVPLRCPGLQSSLPDSA